MNKKIYSGFFRKLKYKLISFIRLFDTNTTANSFTSDDASNTIQRIYIINLDRKPERWQQVSRELKRIKNRLGEPLFNISIRFSAIDARYLDDEIYSNTLCPYYSLAEQLHVEPNPAAPLSEGSER